MGTIKLLIQKHGNKIIINYWMKKYYNMNNWTIKILDWKIN